MVPQKVAAQDRAAVKGKYEWTVRLRIELPATSPAEADHCIDTFRPPRPGDMRDDFDVKLCLERTTVEPIRAIQALPAGVGATHKRHPPAVRIAAPRRPAVLSDRRVHAP